MEALERLSSRIGEIKVGNVAVGQSFLLLAGLGINDALVPLLSAYLKVPALSGAILSVIASLPAVRRIVGPTLSDVLSATAIAVGLNEQFQIRERTQSFVSGILGRLAPKTAGTSELAGTESVSLGQNESLLTEQERRILATMKISK